MSRGKKNKYQRMFSVLADIGLILAEEYPKEKKLFEAFDMVADFVGDVAKGRKK